MASARLAIPFKTKCSLSDGNARGSHRAHGSPESFDFGGSVSGAVLAIVIGMDNRTATSRVGALRSFIRVVRGFAEGSLVVLGFALAILLIGTPLALLARGVHEGLSWLVALRGETSALVEAFVSVSTVLGTVILVAVFVRLLVAILQLAAQVSCPRQQWPCRKDAVESSRDCRGSVMACTRLRASRRMRALKAE